MQHLLDQIIHDVAVVSSKFLNIFRDVLASTQRQRSQLQARDPALGAVLQRGDVRD